MDKREQTEWARRFRTAMEKAGRDPAHDVPDDVLVSRQRDVAQGMGVDLDTLLRGLEAAVENIAQRG